MQEIKNLPINFNKVTFESREGSNYLFRSKYTLDKRKNLTGQDNYFEDLGNAIYRKHSEKDRARAWKFILKHFFFAKQVFENCEGNSKKIFVLDIGCSKGYFGKILRNNIKKGEEVVYLGVDLRKTVLNEAMINSGENNNEQNEKFTSVYLWHDIGEEMPLKSNSFDFVVCSQVIKFLTKSQSNKLIIEIYRLLKEGGTCMLSNGLMFNAEIDYEILRRKKIKKNRKEVYWTTKELVSIFKKNNFKDISVYGGEGSLKNILNQSTDIDREYIDKFRKIFPDEIVEAMFSFLYPESCGVKIFLAKK